jgi:hypothetical protein
VFYSCKLDDSKDVVVVFAVVNSLDNLLVAGYLCEVEEEGGMVIDGYVN